jgi:4-amino-4-deoxy-L-arabinose transferase-like glycosyltransferase
VDASLALAPLSAAAADGRQDRTTHDRYWRLPPGERARRESQLRRLRPGAPPSPAAPRQYEAQQPPLYYWMAAPVYAPLRNLPLPGRVLALRLFGVALASLAIPLAYAMARRAVPSRRLALLVPVLLACLPGFYIDVCRVGNEGAALVAAAAVALCALCASGRAAGWREWLLLGMAMGAALLTKTWALMLLPLPLLAAMRPPRRWKQTAAALAIAAVAAGWWYVRLWVATGTLAGEQIEVAAARLGAAARLRAIFAVDWLAVLDTAAFSHIWVGGWSFLVVRSWMYRVCEAAALLAMIGLAVLAARTLRRPRASFLIVAAAWAGMCAALGWHAVSIYLAGAGSTANGWYLYGAAAAEVVLAALGMAALFGPRGGARALAALCLLALALDLYTMHFLLVPYHTGMIAHRATGSLESFRPALLAGAGGVAELLRRTAPGRPSGIGPGVITGLWAAYTAATALLAALACRLAWPRAGRR